MYAKNKKQPRNSKRKLNFNSDVPELLPSGHKNARHQINHSEVMAGSASNQECTLPESKAQHDRISIEAMQFASKQNNTQSAVEFSKKVITAYISVEKSLFSQTKLADTQMNTEKINITPEYEKEFSIEFFKSVEAGLCESTKNISATSPPLKTSRDTILKNKKHFNEKGRSQLLSLCFGPANLPSANTQEPSDSTAGGTANPNIKETSKTNVISEIGKEILEKASSSLNSENNEQQKHGSFYSPELTQHQKAIREEYLNHSDMIGVGLIESYCNWKCFW